MFTAIVVRIVNIAGSFQGYPQMLWPGGSIYPLPCTWMP